MRPYLKALTLVAVGTMLGLPAAPETQAADLEAGPVKRVRAVRHARVVRDYDGTPVIVRHTRAVALLPDGTTVVQPRIEMVPVMGASPRYYFNGEPVLPLTPRYSLAIRRY